MTIEGLSKEVCGLVEERLGVRQGLKMKVKCVLVWSPRISMQVFSPQNLKFQKVGCERCLREMWILNHALRLFENMVLGLIVLAVTLPWSTSA